MKKSKAAVGKASIPQTELDYDVVRKAALILRALNHKLRQQIVKLIREANDSQTRLTVTDLYVKLKLEQSVCSQHLAILRRANVVSTERRGKFIFYQINDERIKQISEIVELLMV